MFVDWEVLGDLFYGGWWVRVFGDFKQELNY